jgi:lysophospholipase L1-like esterase
VRASAALAAVLLLAAACGGGGGAARATPVPAATSSSEPQIVYAAVGASETVGVGTEDPGSQAWPHVFFRTLPRSAVLYNFGISGATTSVALNQELPQALAVQPNLVTVWLNVDDILAGVAPTTYEDQLGRLVHSLRRGGETRVAVANTPWLDRLPAYNACRANPARCPLGNRALPDPQQVNVAVDAYNAAIARVAQREGAIVVDLHSQGEVVDTHPDWVSADGFHPSAAGAAQVAAAFAAALKS